jgi:site-specific DNA recombinase
MSITPLKHRAALYLRSSKDRSDVSIDAQRRELQKLATDRGLTVSQEYADAVESAKDDRRPAFQQLRGDLRRRDRGWDVLLLLDPSRLSRNQYVAHVFSQECRDRGVQVVYAHMPASDPLVEIVVLPLMHAIAELHSHDSKQKGLTGMAENVRQGWRAGGKAPFGYQIEHVATGAMREGEPVRKSRLVPTADAPRIAGYLRDRATGLPRREAAGRHGITLSDSTLVGIEWNALTYAGCTVWNQHNERIAKGAGYRGGQKHRPRAEWVVQNDTHAALITMDEAETILARLTAYSASRPRAGASGYLLTGMLRTPAGEAWHVDGAAGRYYRTKGRTVHRTAVDAAVLARVAADLRSPEFVGAMLEQSRTRDRSEHRAEIERTRAELASISARSSRFLDMAAQLASPGPVLRKIDELETEREQLTRHLATLESYQRAAEQLATITEVDVMRTLDGLVAQMEHLPPADLRALLSGVIEKVELDPGSLTTAIHYRIAVGHRDKVASPRGAEPIPTVRAVSAATRICR